MTYKDWASSASSPPCTCKSCEYLMQLRGQVDILKNQLATQLSMQNDCSVTFEKVYLRQLLQLFLARLKSEELRSTTDERLPMLVRPQARPHSWSRYTLCVYVRVCMCVSVCASVCMYVVRGASGHFIPIHACIYIYVCMCMCMCMYMLVRPQA